MKIDISTKNITLDEPLKVFVDQKIGGLDRYLAKFKSVSAKVEIGIPSKHHKSGDVFYAEANLKVDGKLLRAQAKHEDLRAAIVDVKEELIIQIAKLKKKPLDRKRKEIK